MSNNDNNTQTEKKDLHDAILEVSKQRHDGKILYWMQVPSFDFHPDKIDVRVVDTNELLDNLKYYTRVLDSDKLLVFRFITKVERLKFLLRGLREGTLQQQQTAKKKSSHRRQSTKVRGKLWSMTGK
jgi:hypothetical protein